MYMQYPLFSITPKAINVVSKYAYCPQFDIVWSFDYAISGNAATEAGFTVFLTQDVNTVGGSGGIDLGYSGIGKVVGQGQNYTYLNKGLPGGVIAVGFDTTGSFPLSTTSSFTLEPGMTHRNGITDSDRILNSVSIRALTSFDYNVYKFNVPIDELDPTFKIVESDLIYKTMRVRLGNIGRTLYIDYRYTPEDVFRNILTYDVDLGATSDTKYKVGASFATPIFTNSITRVGNIFIKNFHTEGSSVSGTIAAASSVLNLDSIYNSNNIAAQNVDEAETPEIVSTAISTENMMDGMSTIINTFNSAQIITLPANSIDGYNFTYQLLLSSVGLQPLNTVLTRVGVFEYRGDNLYLFKENKCTYWTLTGLINGDQRAADNSNSINKTLPTSIFTTTCGTVITLTSTENNIVPPILPLILPVITPTPFIVDCGGVVEYSGEKGTYEVLVNLGTTKGRVTFDYNAYSIQDRFRVKWNNDVVIDTGYVGYAYEESPPDPPIDGPGQGSTFFDKISALPSTALVTVDAPLDGTEWTFTMSCPVPQP